MQEYVSDAVVLAKENRGDLDHTISIFTKHYGKFRVKAKSSKKITSKLSSHLEPGNRIRVRIVEKGGLQVVDALKTERIKASFLDLYHLDKILSEGEPDFKIWTALMHQNWNWERVLGFLGWDPAEAMCYGCGAKPQTFEVRNQEFFCLPCSLKLPKNEIIYLDRSQDRE